jgi:hypothetical protein
MRGFGFLSREMFKLDRLETDRNVAGLIAALGGDARGNAALALGRLGEPRAVPYSWSLFAMTRSRGSGSVRCTR